MSNDVSEPRARIRDQPPGHVTNGVILANRWDPASAGDFSFQPGDLATTALNLSQVQSRGHRTFTRWIKR